MLFVIDRLEFQRAISFSRDDRSTARQGQAGSFMRIEANGDCIKIEGLEALATIPATVYQPGVLFLKITVFRRLLTTFKEDRFLTIQVAADELLMGYVRLPLESNEMLVYADPETAPEKHPSIALAKVEAEVEVKNESVQSLDRQGRLWDGD
jgi:hypothetical protein